MQHLPSLELQNLNQNNLDDSFISSDALSKLKWRARRGLLENDVILSKFFAQYQQLTITQADALTQLCNLTDNELLDLIFKKTTLPEAIDTPDVQEILQLLQDL